MIQKVIVELIHDIFQFILHFVEKFGYLGIFFMTFIESTFIPIPSEFTLIPAGYLISKGDMHIFPVVVSSLLGTLLGSLLNYTIAIHFGRKLFMKYGKYFFLKEGQLHSLELFFSKYGNISTFFGRMLPGVKHFISFPAGLARMNIKLFCIYTLLGSFVWLSFLVYIGYLIGGNEALIAVYIKKFNYIIIAIVLTTGIGFYIKRKYQKNNN
ncbi:MAG: membrane protein DedA with SNARE-associated domain [Candidatus Midichloriaceae bacterium]|jgi:membrane protein DedA with SNARE-associated domain